tara:strand:+ start:31600 stop:31770 length:171 start_codon:yes stop_codon:yes gene_type:complete
MHNEFEQDIPESEGFLEKDSGRKDRMTKSSKARLRRERKNAKIERQYEDGFRGNCD